jgi:cell division protein FtsI (penicillin-binding protein 3)
VSNLPSRRIAWMRVRIALLALVLMAGAGAVVYRAWDLQIVRAEVLRRMAQEQYLRDIRLSPKRGSIYDRNGAVLAVSVDVDSVWANPRVLQKANRDPAEAARQLASVLDIDPGVIAQRLSSKRYFVWIKRRITPQQTQSVRSMKIPGVSVLQEARRFYPNRELAAHILGFADIDGVGIEGLELSFEDRLRGSLDTVPAIRDRRGDVVFSEQLLDHRAAQGDELHLTIDRTIQRAAEKELELTIRTFEARAGSVVALDPRTGEILAMANYPTFNPNHPGAYPPSHRRNRAVTDRFEPGSTTKVFTVAGALAKGAIRPDKTIDCEDGVIQVAEHWIHDTRKWEELTPAQVLSYSSNIGAAKIGLAMGRASLFRTLRRFGFGQPSEIELPGETTGILPHYKRWYEMDAATISFGQGISVNTVQLAFATGAVANRGKLLKPILVKRISDARGQTVVETLPYARRQAVPAWAAELIGDMMTGVTDKGGTAEEAAIEGYLVAGKTGTAQKADYINGGYAKDKWIASFIGFVPARRPRLVIAAVIDEPIIAHQGGTVAAPLFRRLARKTLRHLGVPPGNSRNALAAHIRKRRILAQQLAQERQEQARESPPEVRVDAPTRNEGKPVDGDSIRVPDLTGKDARAALSEVRELDLFIRLKGSGLVAFQKPAAGERVPRNGTVQVRLEPPHHHDQQNSMAASPGDKPTLDSSSKPDSARPNGSDNRDAKDRASAVPRRNSAVRSRKAALPKALPTISSETPRASVQSQGRDADVHRAASLLAARTAKERL